MTVLAQVVDITTDSPNDKDRFFVDTNAWLWTTYSHAGLSPNPPLQHQVRIVGAKAKLLGCGLSLAELAHQIEKAEREIYNRANNLQLSTKEYRHNLPAERNKVVKEIQSSWAQVTMIATDIEVLINSTSSDSALTSFASYTLDGYDLFVLEAMRKAGVNQIITDDGDYATVLDMQVFTCNRNVLSLARQQGMMLIR